MLRWCSGGGRCGCGVSIVQGWNPTSSSLCGHCGHEWTMNVGNVCLLYTGGSLAIIVGARSPVVGLVICVSYNISSAGSESFRILFAVRIAGFGTRQLLLQTTIRWYCIKNVQRIAHPATFVHNWNTSSWFYCKAKRSPSPLRSCCLYLEQMIFVGLRSSISVRGLQFI